MNITLYTTHCPMCNVLEKKLNMMEIPFEINEDPNEIRKLGYLSAPILKVDEDTYTFKEACTWVDSFQKESK